MLHHSAEYDFELADGARHEGDITEVAILMQFP